jgi:hypothetical protein
MEASLMDRTKLVTGSALVLSFVLLAPSGVALADGPCALMDLGCIVGTADLTVDDAVDTGGSTTQAAVHQVETTVDDVQGRVRDLLGSGGDEPGGGGGNGGNVGNGHGGGDGGPRHDGSGNGALRHPTRASSMPSTDVGVPTPGTAPTLVTTMGYRFADRASAGEGIPGALREAATGIALPLVVVLLLLFAFTAIQDRLDRRDPKLALAPLATDVLRFE